MVALLTPEPAPTPPHQRSPLTGTALTLVGFFSAAAALCIAPGVPAYLRPIDLDTADERVAVATRLVRRPQMTLAEHEAKLEGAAPAVDDDLVEAGPAVAAAEEAELHEEPTGEADLHALKSDAVAVNVDVAASSEGDDPAVDRAAVVERAAKRGPTAKRAARLREKHRALGMPGAAIDNPCVDAASDDDCARTALDPFFATLDGIARGDAQARANVLVFGNSLIASDHLTDIVRDELVARFGDGGRGYLLVDRLSKVAGRRVRTGTGTETWAIRNFAQDPPLPEGLRFGFAGSLHEATVDGEATTWSPDGARTGRLFWLDTGKGLRVLADGVEVLRVAARKDAAVAPVAKAADFRVPPGAKKLALLADAGARVFGVALERETPGVIVETIGVPAASARLYVDATDGAIFREQVKDRDPALVTLMLGGNETRGIAYGNITPAVFEQKLNALLDRVEEAAPRAACLIVTPIDAAKTTTGSEELVTREEITSIIDVERRVARARGCAFFDLFSAMGGRGALQKMRAAELVSDDLVHPTARGGDVLGQLIADALLQGYVDTAAPRGVAPFTREHNDDGPRYAGLSFPKRDDVAVVVDGDVIDDGTRAPPLSRFFARLRELDRGERQRVAIGQFGASHTAGQMLTDRMRDRLGARFGLVGRGFVSVGKASKRLEPSGVRRELTGDVEVADGREVTVGGALGMSGTKARLMPGARFRVGFCQACRAADLGSPSQQNGRLQLAWLYTPDMGTADVLVDGQAVATLSPKLRRAESDVQFLSLPVANERAVLEVVARKEARPMHAAGDVVATAVDGVDGVDDDVASPVGPVHLLSVSEEMDRKGIVLDAVGLPGTTGMTPQRWRQDLYSEEVRARRYDLIVTAWGTNEAGIASLDEATYRHHFGNTLRTLKAAAPEADCLIVGASDRFDDKGGVFVPAPNHELVERVQRSLAAEHGCAFFSLRTAMGGPGSMRRWVKDGVGHPDHVHFTRDGYHKLADIFVDDLMQAFAAQATAAAGQAPAQGQDH